MDSSIFMENYRPLRLHESEMFLKLFLKEQAAKLEEFEMTKQKRSKKEEQSVEEKTTLHGKRTKTLVPCIYYTCTVTNMMTISLYLCVCHLSPSFDSRFEQTVIYSLDFFLPVQDSTDYQGRSYLHIPKDIDIKLDTDQAPERCYLPKKHIHTWSVK